MGKKGYTSEMKWAVVRDKLEGKLTGSSLNCVEIQEFKKFFRLPPSQSC
ncbi:MAG: hypothetical protein LRY71_05255 [Bacillaceae bacterium]|nr:hypothetical protein [Bacillaceae bacterium]